MCLDDFPLKTLWFSCLSLLLCASLVSAGFSWVFFFCKRICTSSETPNLQRHCPQRCFSKNQHYRSSSLQHGSCVDKSCFKWTHFFSACHRWPKWIKLKIQPDSLTLSIAPSFQLFPYKYLIKERELVQLQPLYGNIYDENMVVSFKQKVCANVDRTV